MTEKESHKIMVANEWVDWPAAPDGAVEAALYLTQSAAQSVTLQTEKTQQSEGQMKCRVAVSNYPAPPIVHQGDERSVCVNAEKQLRRMFKDGGSSARAIGFTVCPSMDLTAGRRIHICLSNLMMELKNEPKVRAETPIHLDM